MASENAAKSKTYEGGCHCGSVKYTINMTPPIEEGQASICNCSICHIHGYVFVQCPVSNCEFKSGEQDMTAYQFGKHIFTHYFCKTCGVAVGGKPEGSGKEMMGDIWAINVRTLKDVDLDNLSLKKIDGRSF